MTKRPKSRKTVKRRKPGPREERLVITGDPQAALDKLLKKPITK
jgi:hypothetical protein